MLVDQPFPSAGVSVTGPNVLGLEVFKLAVDVVAVRHDPVVESTNKIQFLTFYFKVEMQNGQGIVEHIVCLTPA